MNIRVRFAPSPTGPLHIGGIRTALFNYIFAKKNNGKLILRIEDTDQHRYTQGSEKYIYEALKWINITFDESPEKQGNYGPYKQSERIKIYKHHIKQLLEQNKAYYAFDTAEELDQMRQALQKQKASVQHYNNQTRTQMKNSFTLSEQQIKNKINNNEPYVVRFNMPQNENLILNDIVRGKIKVNTSTLDDKILFKSDGFPTYHLANIVDDHLMEISHVIRGEEWLPSMPLHILLYQAFNWTPPQFAHLPLILKPNGKGKLSKRDADKGGFPVFPTQWTDPKTHEQSQGYKETGYLPQAIINMLALLGWNPGNQQEIFNINELIKTFDINKIHKAGAKFDPEKTKWFNQQHLKLIKTENLVDKIKQKLKTEKINCKTEKIKKIINTIRDRAIFETDIWELSKFFFIPPKQFDPKAVKKNWKPDTPKILEEISKQIQEINKFTSENIEEKIIEKIKTMEIGLGKALNPIRLTLVGNTTGPHLFDIIEIIGKQQTIKRLDYGIKNIK